MLKSLLPRTLTGIERDRLTRTIGWLLPEPTHHCGRILREFLLQRAIAAQRWQDVMQGRFRVSSVVQGVQLQDETELRCFLHSHHRGLVVATFHAGDYLSMLLKLTSMLPSDRYLHVVRRADAQTRRDNTILPTLLPNVRVVLDDRASIRAAVLALRRGHLLTVLCDLPGSWGPSQAVTLLGRDMRWTRSVTDFAVLGAADLLPLTNHLTTRGECVSRAHALIEHAHIDRQRSMQNLASIAGRLIQHFPGQWHQWPLVPAMAHESDQP